MSVSSAPPASSVSQSAATTGGTTAQAAAVVVQVLAAYGGDSVRNGLVQTLQNSTGPGNLLSGTITDVRADGTFTLQTKSGAEFTLQKPPDLPLNVGSAVTLRLVAVAPQPQVAILTVDGKLVAGPPTGATVATPSFPPPPAGAPPPLVNPLPAAVPGLAPATLASTVFAAISLGGRGRDRERAVRRWHRRHHPGRRRYGPGRAEQRDRDPGPRRTRPCRQCPPSRPARAIWRPCRSAAPTPMRPPSRPSPAACRPASPAARRRTGRSDRARSGIA